MTPGLKGHQPSLFKGQKAAVLAELLRNRGEWVPSFRLAAIALQYSARIKELRDAGYCIENRTERVGHQVHGYFRLLSCPGEEEHSQPLQRQLLGVGDEGEGLCG